MPSNTSTSAHAASQKVRKRIEEIFGWQRAAFAAQLAIARRLDAPVVVHSRGAFAECVAMIDASGVDWRRVVFHCFSEGEAEMAELLKRGGRGSFTGILTYKAADSIRAAAKLQGLERFLLETDAPYLTPMPHRGKPNEPAFLRHTAEYAAGLFGVDLATLAQVSTANAKAFFGLFTGVVGGLGDRIPLGTQRIYTVQQASGGHPKHCRRRTPHQHSRKLAVLHHQLAKPVPGLGTSSQSIQN